MTRIVMVWIICSLLTLASFGILMLEDTRLGVALPYSLPLAFVGAAAAGPALFALFERLRAKRTIVVHREPEVEPGQPFRMRDRRRSEGVVLLDQASIAACRRRVA
jgi:hypothetical protein